jgi:hypothetical protein
VPDGAVEFDRVLVHFSIRYKVPADGQTRVIDLPGERHSAEKPTVQAFGLR